MHSALDVAAWFLNAIDRKAGDSITNLKLQKLVYYAQAWALALLDRALFAEPVEAWAHGPVVDAVYQEFKPYGFDTLPRSPRRPRFEPDELLLLEDVLRIYGERSASFLEDLTHREDPWKAAWGDRPPKSRSRQTIPPASMRSFYRDQFENRENLEKGVDVREMRLMPARDGVLPLPPRPRGDSWAPDAEFIAEANASARAIGRIRRARSAGER